ncbi:preQ(1) synthase [Chitinophaga nivalis]|uniref:7-cyano-7-deazaguanine reductase n=1 Tax=Chitinophaga nivalis TaxID=2991709 RepID=A0ABT3ILM0_9BACT|nr:7-cyano-7-deazaguanine reductase [Chitinophaga nivalis]MCW3465503.1 7-cyano-7-deazaguanine reductase [Chitinophaga nivalis]MCW3484806.1 7-cyano-7-deazaguanine reductase [Chitinophaga nivalis]
MSKKLYHHIDKTILKGLPNPSREKYEMKIKVPEFTFLGVQEQPDFAKLYITFYPKNKIIELKSLKHYVYHLRDIIVSYERLINIIYDHMMEVYDADRLRITLICNPRGGISSKLVIDSDWKDRGGTERFRDYPERDDEWGILM